MTTSTISTRFISRFLPCLALVLAACADLPEIGVEERALGAPEESYTPELGSGVLDPATMQALFYGINPPRHAEKAYLREDGAPSLHPRPTTVGRAGTIVVLATTIYNRPPFGKLAAVSLCDRDGRTILTLTVPTPGRIDVAGFDEGTEVYIRPETIGTMVKLLTPEQIAGVR